MSEALSAVAPLKTLKSWADELRQKAEKDQNAVYENPASKIENKVLELESESLGIWPTRRKDSTSAILP